MISSLGRRALAISLAATLSLSTIDGVLANELPSDTQAIVAESQEGDKVNETENNTSLNSTSEISENAEQNDIVAIEDLEVQLNDLYHRVGDYFKIDYLYIKILHLLAGGKAVYAEELPNIYCDETVNTLEAPLDIEGANTNYVHSAPWAECTDESIERPSKYYIPDAIYNVTADVIKIMNKRSAADRGVMQDYFDALTLDVKTNILFCEAILEYTGNSEETVNSFYSTYEKLVYDKAPNENVIEVVNGEYAFKDKFKTTVISNGITDEQALNNLALILSFDGSLAAASDASELLDYYVIPYEVDYQSRENMMIAAMAVVGKARYVWGGGHLEAANLEGINPVWEKFNDSYGRAPDEAGYDKCIKPSVGYCPVHGNTTSENGCLFSSETMYSSDEYINYIVSTDIDESVDIEKMANLLSAIDFDGGITAHRLDGFDCSGFSSWLYNQVSESSFNSGAMNFIGQSGIKQLSFGSQLYAGDVFSWGNHIVVIVGPSRIGGNAYVTIEATPNMVKFGVAYYGNATTSDISKAISIANDANDLIGNLPDSETAHIYNMTNCVFTDESYGEQWVGYHAVGRLAKSFIDENTIIPEFNKTIKQMNALEIIQHTIDNMPYTYLSGMDTYEGTLFNLDKIKANMKDIVVSDEVQETAETSYMVAQEYTQQ